MVVVCLTALFGAHANEPESGHVNILVIHAYHQGFRWTDHIMESISEEFGDDTRVELFVEYMDTKRRYTDEYLARLRDLYAYKYRNVPFQVIIASDDNALDFILLHRDRLFPGVPVVFCGVNDFQPARIEGHRGITGVNEQPDFLSTVKLGLSLFPDTWQINVVSDQTITGQLNTERFNEEVTPYYKDVIQFVYLTNETIDELCGALQQAPEDSLTLALSFYRDREGVSLSSDKSAQLVAEFSRAPVLTMWDYYLIHGVLGGHIVSGKTQGRHAAAKARAILEGTPVEDLPVQMQSPNVPILDWRVVEHFNIPEASIPPYTYLLYRPVSVYKRYRIWIWIGLGFLALQMALIIGLLVNLALRRKARVELLESREQLELVLQGADLCTWHWDMLSDRVDYNDRWTQTLGFAPGEVKPDIQTWWSQVHPDDVKILRDCIENHMAGKTELLEAEYRIRHKDGHWIWMLGRGRITRRGPNGEPLYAAGTFLDISLRKQAEEEHRMLEQQVQHTQKLESLGVLAGGIAHDFNNLLMTILGNADLALRDISPVSPASPFLNEIVAAANCAADLCRQMLAYSGKGRFVVEAIDLNELVTEMTHMLEVSISKKITLKYNLADRLPAIKADATQIRQIIMNLITNASEAVGEQSGAISVTTGAMHCDKAYLSKSFLKDNQQDGMYVYIEVADTGCGMDAETQARLFDPFFTTKFSGRGLGMAAVLGIVRGHHGALHVYSEPGRGTGIKVLFPSLENVNVTKDAVDVPAEASLVCAQTTVLVVDDEETVRVLVRRMLEKLGCQVLTAVDGAEALRIFEEQADEIDCVLLDLTMPRMDGSETFRVLQKIKPDVRVIMSSGYNEQEVTQQFVGQGLAGFVQKPYTLSALKPVLNAVLAGRPTV